MRNNLYRQCIIDKYVEFLYSFLVKNKGVGPYGREANKEGIEKRPVR